VDLRMEVRERRAQAGVELAVTGLVGRGAGLGVWSTKSSAKSSSNTSKSPLLCTYSVLRRTTAFAASLTALPFAGAMKVPPGLLLGVK
jgi:hypothetical protein